MSDPRLPVRQGQRLQIAASQINALNQMMRVGGGATMAPGSAPTYGQNIVLAYNGTVADVPRFGVMAIDSLVIDPSQGDRHAATFSEMPCISGRRPSDDPNQKFVIPIEPIRRFGIGRAILAGVAAVKLNIRHASHATAEPHVEEASELWTCHGGPAEIIWKEPGTGSGKWGLVRIGNMTHHKLCKASAAFPKGTTATLNVWEDGSLANEAQTTGSTLPDVMNVYADIGANKFVSVARHGNGRWYVVAAEC